MSQPNEKNMPHDHEDTTSDNAPEHNDEPSDDLLKEAWMQAAGHQADEPDAASEAADSAAPAPGTDDEKDREIADLKDQLLRAVAETENVRRRAQRDVEESGKYAITNFARDIVGVCDNLYRAAEAVPQEAREGNDLMATLAQGVDMTLNELIGALERSNITRIDPMGQPFDHNLHQAVVQIEHPDAEPGTVLQVMQAGYTLHNRLLRPAMVGVAKRPEQTPEDPQVDTQA